jgi:hypothetical protein
MKTLLAAVLGISEHVDWKIMHLPPLAAIALAMGLLLAIALTCWLVWRSGTRR